MKMRKKEIKTPLNSILKFLFYLSLLPVLFFLLPIILFFLPLDLNQIAKPIGIIQLIIVIPAIILWGYCIYFYYKFDRYSSAGIKLFFLNGLYAPYYFYKVIWKQKRKLINEIKHEPVLGNKIHLED
jgi:hypothetical protein